MKKRICFIVLIIIIVLSALLLKGKKEEAIEQSTSQHNQESTEMNTVPDTSKFETDEATTAIEESIIPTEENFDNLSEEMLEGDSGEEEEEDTITSYLEVPEERATKAGFQQFVLSYSGTQNYTKDGFNFGYANILYEDGISMNDSAARINGMGNAGYIVWLLRNTFGICDENYQTPFKIYQESPKVDWKELQIGDLGFIYDSDQENNFCGICIGYAGDEPVFSFMDGTWSEKFPFGSNRLCFIRRLDTNGESIDPSMSVAFEYFCRPSLNWEGSEEGVDLISYFRPTEQEIENSTDHMVQE